MQQFLDFLEKNQQLILSYSVKVLVALVILYLGRWLSKSLTRMLEKALIHRKVDRAVVSFLSGIIQAAIMVATILIALSQVGIQTASFIAILGAAGLAIALALQGSLSNFASGVLIILFRPFRAGDFVDAAGVSGVVEKIEIFQTVLKSPDNKRIIVPNSQITGSAIVNYSAEKTRRVDLTVGISYDSDLKKSQRTTGTNTQSGQSYSGRTHCCHRCWRFSRQFSQYFSPSMGQRSRLLACVLGHSGKNQIEL